MLHKARDAYTEALDDHLAEALAEQRAAIVSEAENALAQEQIQQTRLKAEFMQSLTETNAAADANLEEAYKTIQSLHGAIQRQELSQAELNGQLQSLQTAMETQNDRINAEMNSVHRKHASEVQQIQERQAQQAKDQQQVLNERELHWNREVIKLTTDLERYRTRGSILEQGQAALQRGRTAEQRAPYTPSFSPTRTCTPTSMPTAPEPPPARLSPLSEHRRDIFSCMTSSAGGDPRQAGGDSRREPSPAPRSGQQSAERGDPGFNQRTPLQRPEQQGGAPPPGPSPPGGLDGAPWMTPDSHPRAPPAGHIILRRPRH